MYVPEDFRLSKEAVDQQLALVNHDNYTADWTMILKIHYAYTHDTDPNFDGGLSLIHRIIAKVGHRHQDWNVVEFRNRIINSNDPQFEYISVISEMLADEVDRMIYGL